MKTKSVPFSTTHSSPEPRGRGGKYPLPISNQIALPLLNSTYLMKFHAVWGSRAGKAGGHSSSCGVQDTSASFFPASPHSPLARAPVVPSACPLVSCFSHKQMLLCPSFLLHVSVLALAAVPSRLPLNSHHFQRGHLLTVLALPLVILFLLSPHLLYSLSSPVAAFER